MKWKLLLLALVSALCVTAAVSAQGILRNGVCAAVATTMPEQQRYLNDLNALQNQLQQKRQEMQALMLQPQPSEAVVRAKRVEIVALQDKLFDLNWKNRELRQQMGAACPGYGMGGGCGMGLGCGGGGCGAGYGCGAGFYGRGRGMRGGMGRGFGRGW